MGSLILSVESSHLQGTKMKLLLFESVLTFGQLVSSQFPIQGLVGQWVEDDSVRTGLNDFLWARGVSSFKRQFITSKTFQKKETIIWRNGEYQISGVKGPKKEAFNYNITPNNFTIEMIDLGAGLGGMREATAEIVGNSLVTYLKVPGPTGAIDIIATRSMNPDNPGVMYYKARDVPYDYEMVATMKRQT